MNSYLSKMEKGECPFTWNLDEIPNRAPPSVTISKLSLKDEEITEPWVHFCIKLTTSYLLYEDNQLVKAVNTLKDCGRMMDLSSDNQLVRYKVALESIYSASRTFLAIKNSTLSEIKEFSDGIIPFDEMSEDQQSAVCAIKANVFLEFSVSGTEKAVEFTKEALRLNPEEADWHFLLGNLYSKIRHFNNIYLPDDAEIHHFQIANKLEKSCRTAIFLANCYVDKCKNLILKTRRNGTYDKNLVSSLATEAKQLVLFTVEKNKNQDIHIMCRCAYALINLPPGMKEFDKGIELLQEVRRRFPLNITANLMLGKLYLKRYIPEYERALKCYEIAASQNVYTAEIAVIDINVALGNIPDAEEFYSRILAKYPEQNYTLLTLLHATEYFLFIRRDLYKAIDHFLKVVKLNPGYSEIKERYVNCVKQRVNYYELLCNEARLALKFNTYQSFDQKTLLKQIILEIEKYEPLAMEKPLEERKIERMVDFANIKVLGKSVSRGGSGRSRGTWFGPGGLDRRGYSRPQVDLLNLEGDTLGGISQLGKILNISKKE